MCPINKVRNIKLSVPNNEHYRTLNCKTRIWNRGDGFSSNRNPLWKKQQLISQFLINQIDIKFSPPLFPTRIKTSKNWWFIKKLTSGTWGRQTWSCWSLCVCDPQTLWETETWKLPKQNDLGLQRRTAPGSDPRLVETVGWDGWWGK